MRRLLATVLGSAIVSLSCSVSDTPLPSYPHHDVTLLRDDLGVTHVYAKDDEDAFFGSGYAMARDRLFQMELFRRQALGRSAELFGAKSKKADVGARAFNFGRLGEQDEERTRREHPDDAKLADAWVAGVNTRIAEIARGEAPRPYGFGQDELDFLPEPWKTSQTFAIGKLLAFGLSNSLDAEILATAILNLAPDFAKRVPFLQPSYDVFPMVSFGAGKAPVPAVPPPIDPKLVLPADAFRGPAAWPDRPLGSNNWGVVAAKSDNGKPRLAGDPHQALTNPTRLYPIQLEAETGLDVFGFSFVGTPAVELGQTARVGWTATTNFADVMDLWDVSPDPDFTKLMLGDGEHGIITRRETIRVRGDGRVGTGEDDVVELHDVPGYGILLPDSILPVPRSFLVKGGAILFQWTGFRPTQELSAYLAMDRAATVGDFEAAVSLIDCGAQNFLAADEKSLLYHVHALIPDRGPPSSHPMPWRILDGMDARTLWTHGDLAPERLPHLLDPQAGFFGSANTDPWGHTSDGNVENDPFYYGTFFANGFRLHRIDEELSALVKANPISASDLERLQRDVRSPLADTWIPELSLALAAAKSDPNLASYAGRADLQELGASLVAWNRMMTKENGEPLAFTAFHWFAARRVFEPLATKTLFDAIAAKSPPFWPGLLRNVTEARFSGSETLLPGGRDLLFLQALDDAQTWLLSRFGTIDPTKYRWDDQMQAAFPNAFGEKLAVTTTPINGGLDTISVANAPFFDGDQPAALAVPGDAPLYRMVMGFDAAGRVVTSFDLARGTSEDPADPFFSNLQPSWAKAEHLPLPFARVDVEGRTHDVKLLPAAR
ncbi:penicillin acylase family protein [soil metagenome]